MLNHRTASAHLQRLAAAALVLLLLFAGSVGAAELEAQVDRSVVSETETLRLTVRVNEQVGYDSPDFSELREDFDILSQQRSSQFRSINGRIEAWTDWDLVLAPKSRGTLTIPSFSFQGAVSDPIQVTVSEAPPSDDDAQDIFVEVITDKDEVYVQEQLLVTIRIHTGIMLRDASMNEDLSVEDAVVENVSETAYNEQRNGRMYRVMELVYAVYPQKSGSLTIPSLSWNLVMATDRGSGLRYRFQAPGQLRRLRSDEKNIPVNARPTSYQSGPWLPARDLKLEQHWSSDPSRFVVGEPITRTVTIIADGLTSAQLPPLPEQNVDGLRVYSDQAQYDDIKSSEGIIGNRIESIAIVPTKPGKITLPETRVTWWDTEADRQRVATLPPQTLEIAPAAGSPAVQVSPTPGTEQAAADSEQVDSVLWNFSWLWLLSNALFAALALFFMLAWLQARRSREAPTVVNTTQTDPRLEQAYHDVRRACSDKDPRAARSALARWGQLYWRLPHAASLQEIMARADSEALTKQLAELDKILYGYGSTEAAWQGDKLWRALVKFKRKDKKKRQSHADGESLPPLYPTNR